MNTNEIFSVLNTVDRWYPRTLGGEIYALNENSNKTTTIKDALAALGTRKKEGMFRFYRINVSFYWSQKLDLMLALKLSFSTDKDGKKYRQRGWK